MLPHHIILVENGCLERVALDADEVAHLRQSGLVDVAPGWEPGYYSLAARSVVGRIALPNRLVIITPKAPIANLFSMLARVAGRSHLRVSDAAVAGYAEGDPLLRGLIDLYLQTLDEYLTAGVRRRPTQITEATPFVRGKLLLTPTLRQSPAHRHRLVTQRTEWSADNLLNQLLKQAARVARVALQENAFSSQQGRSQSLTPQPPLPPGEKGGGQKQNPSPSPSPKQGGGPASRGGGVGSTLVRRLDHTLAQLHAIENTHHAEAVFDRVLLTRLESDAAPALVLARWLVAGCAPTLGTGLRPFPTFWLDVARLFEDFVARLLWDELTDAQVTAQRATPLDQAAQVSLRPDVVVQPPGRPPLVLDTKYKLPGPPQPGDLYQLLTYCQALGATHGALVYPAPTQAPPIIVRQSGLAIHALALDLGAGEGLATSSAAFVEQVRGLL